VTNRDPVELANNDVSIRALGISGVLQLSVSDRDPKVATAVSNTLAARVIRTRVNARDGQVQEVLEDLDKRIDKLNRGIASAASATSDAARSSRDALARQRGVLESERASLLSNDALRLKPSIISPATSPRHADSSRWLPYLVLGALLGFVLAIGSAGLIETLRPTLVGGNAVAREFDAPLLGRLRGGGGDDRLRADLQPLSSRLRLAAETAGLKNLALLAAMPDSDVEALAEQLEANSAREGALADRSPLRIRPFSLEDPAEHDPSETGLVLLSPDTIKKAELEDVHHLLRVMPLRVLGLITYMPLRGSRFARAAPASAPGGSTYPPFGWADRQLGDR
jgi:hypothetical protein